MRVLVTGGTGVVGKPAVDCLLDHGHAVRILSRHAERDVRQWADGVEPMTASVGDAESLRGACDGCDAVLHIAGIVEEDPPEVTFERINVQGTRHLLDEAVRAGVRRFVYVSSLGAERGASDYHRSKRAAEEVVREFDGSWLILRPGNVYGPDDEVISLLLRMLRTLPMIPLVGSGDQPFQPICADDLGLALALAVERGQPAREVLQIAGPEVTSTNDVLDRLERLTEIHPARVPVPEWIAQAGAEAADWLGVDVPVNADQLIMLREGNVLDAAQPNALTDVFGITPTPLDEGLARLVDTLPEQLPSEGLGGLHRQRYWADIRDSRFSARELLELVQREFASLPPDGMMQVVAEPGAPHTLDPGATLTLHIPLRGNIQVRVEEVSDEAITLVTLKGHPLSGAIRFATEAREGLVRFEIRSYTRSADLLDLVGMRIFGHGPQRANWRAVVEEVVRRSGGVAVDGVHDLEEALAEEDAREVEEWVEDLVMRRRREEDRNGVEPPPRNAKSS